MIVPGSAPEPPPDLHRRKLIIEEFPTGTQLYRFHPAAYEATYFDTSQNPHGSRFNAPDGKYGVMYTAISLRGAFAETFLRTVGSTALSEAFVKSKACASYTLTHSLRAVRLRGYGLAPIGATASVCTCPPPYVIPQAWSAALRDHPDRPDAILYGSRHDDDQLCLAVFDRAADAMGTPIDMPDLLGEDWFYELMDLYGVGLV
jgi:hypothetical protein